MNKNMNKKCYVCNSMMEHKITSVKVGWGDYKLTVDGIEASVCPKCGEVVIEAKDAIMLQKLSKSLKDIDNSNKPDVLNLTEVADLLRVSSQTVYNMIRDGRLKAHKFGREWRFIRKDIQSFMSDDSYDIAARGKSSQLNKKDSQILTKYV